MCRAPCRLKSGRRRGATPASCNRRQLSLSLPRWRRRSSSPFPTPPPVVLPAIGQAQAAQPPAQAEQPRVTTQQPAPVVEEAVARPPAADAASLPVRIDTPISVRANSWIELRAPNGDVLAQTYVRAGESYVVPAGIAYRIIDAR